MAHKLSKFQSTIALCSLLLLIVWGALAGQSVREAPAAVNPAESDLYLYIAIAERVADGENYYDAAALEQTERGYPVQPASTIRTPTSILIIDTFGPKGAYVAFAIVLALSLVGGMFLFEKLSRNRLMWLGSSLLFVGSLALFGPLAVYYQETWAVLFIFLSLTVRARSLAAAVALAFVACLFRELALPFVFAMCVFELYQRRRAPAFAWAITGIAFLALYAVHANAVAEAVSRTGVSSPGVSPGWFAFGGWPFIVGSVQSVTVLSALPLWVSVIVVPLALLGWLMRKGETALSFSFAILGFVIPFLFIGRPNNNYWALLYAALMLPGLAFSWAAIREIVRALVSKPDSSAIFHQKT